VVLRGDRTHIGDVAVFKTSEEALDFLRRLEAAINHHNKPDPKSRTWSVRVIVHLLDKTGMSRFAAQRKSMPYAGAAVAFLNPGAVHACREFAITYPESDAPDRTIPQETVERINRSYFSKVPFAGADPQ
jgi:hypothetical protein